MVWHVPESAQPGDIALAVHGAYAPLVVRLTGNISGEPTYRYIGPAVLPDRSLPLVLSGEVCGAGRGLSQLEGISITYYLSELLRGPEESFSTYCLV